MTTSSKINFTFSADKKSVEITRHFDAPLPLVWKAWTESAILDKWWAPKPWKAETKKMEFRNTGQWLYCMRGPDGESSWGLMTFQDIQPLIRFSVIDTFSDEEGNINTEFPSTHWDIQFKEEISGTLLKNVLISDKAEDLQQLIDMGFQEGYTMALDNLEEWLSEHKI